MNAKSMLVALATAVAFTTVVAEPSFARGDRGDRYERGQMSRGEASRRLISYFENRGYSVRLRRPYTRGNFLYAKVYTRSGNSLGMYRVDLRSGRVRRVN